MKILVLAGGSDQIALINELKRRRHEVILVDYFDNPPAKPFADKHIVSSTLDVENVTKIAIEEHVRLITTACTDQALLTVAQISEALSLPCYISYQTALNVTNKAYMKKMLLDNNISTAKYKIAGDINIKSFESFSFPIVVKPVDCNSSNGVTKVYNKSELSNALEKAISLSRTNTAIVEEFQEGVEISADFYIENNTVKLLSVTGSTKIKGIHSFTIIQSYYPAITHEKEEMLLHIARQIANAFDLKNTPLLVQLIEKDDCFCVIEFSARMGGGSKYKLIQTLSGVDIMKVYVDLILGNKPFVNPHKQVEYALINYIYCTPGKFVKIKGIEELKQKGVIDEYFLYKTEGMEIFKAETSSDRVAGFLITSQHKDLLDYKLRLCDENIQVLNEHGKDIMIHDIYISEIYA
ncbi:MAG: ATP-grasp domain-containing protein [Bacteroidales bacterium]|jgi:phosphoribosylamine-glycine ligase|nr:ATP-grasp domain-containing protein [Bacteroidales bacterium]